MTVSLLSLTRKPSTCDLCSEGPDDAKMCNFLLFILVLFGLGLVLFFLLISLEGSCLFLCFVLSFDFIANEKEPESD